MKKNRLINLKNLFNVSCIKPLCYELRCPIIIEQYIFIVLINLIVISNLSNNTK